MLKQIITLIISLTIIVLAGIWEIKYIDQSARYLLSDIEYSKNALKNDNFKLAKSHVENLEATWNNLKKVWNVFVVQEEIDGVDNLIATYKIHTEYGNEEESMADCDLLKRMIEDIVQKHQIKYENIF